MTETKLPLIHLLGSGGYSALSERGTASGVRLTVNRWAGF